MFAAIPNGRRKHVVRLLEAGIGGSADGSVFPARNIVNRGRLL